MLNQGLELTTRHRVTGNHDYDLLVRCPEREGVTAVFGIPGEENIGFADALARSPIRYVLVRHEQAASFMAGIYGRLTGRAGVCPATLGPGAINLLPGTADATTNSSPVVALSAQVGLDRIYKESHQSVNLVSMFRLYPTYEPNTCLTSNGLSAMAFALPGAIGAKLVNSAGDLLPILTEALSADTVSVIACPVDYSENLRLTDTLGELSGPF